MAQQQNAGGGGGSQDNSMAPVWITALIFFAIFLVWYVAHAYIVAFVFKINLAQAHVLKWFMHDAKLNHDIYIMQTINPAFVSWNQMVALSSTVGYYMRYPAVVLLVLSALVLYRSNITLKFRRAHTMSSLRIQEQYNWPAIMPVVKHDIVAEDVSKGPWAMALSPMELAEKYQLLRKEDMILDKKKPGEEMTAGVRKADAKRVFTLQLGPYWEGFHHCAPHVHALAAMFLARINRDRASAVLILETIDKSYATGKPNFAVASPIIKKYQTHEVVQEICQKHAYLLTVMASLLEAARQDGVVPSAEFLWLKTVDRRLWYMLNSVGRQTPFAEVAGPFAHWKAEKAMQRRSLVPMIDEATKALELAIKDIKLSPKAFRELKP